MEVTMKTRNTGDFNQSIAIDNCGKIRAVMEPCVVFAVLVQELRATLSFI